MTLFSDLIAETRQHLMTSQPDKVNVLDANVDALPTTTTVTLRHANKGVAEGARLVIGLEEMHVISINAVGALTECTVIRAFGGSTIAAHTAGDLIYINPPFSDYRIAKFINQALDNLSSEGLFRVNTKELTASSSAIGYDLTTPDEIMNILHVRYDTSGSLNNWPILRADEYYIDYHANTTDFASGQQLVIRNGGEPGKPIRVTYTTPYTQLVNLTDDVENVSGLHSQAHDLPPLYAALCLLAGREVKRTFMTHQPEPRRQEEVPVGGASQAMRPLIERYYTRLDTEVKRLRRKYPRQI